MKDQTDIELVYSCQQGDRTAEKMLFYRFAPLVLTICRRYASDESLAKDYLQECFIKLFDELHRFKPDKGDFRPWMYRVCTNHILGFLRKKPMIELVAIPESLPEEEPEPEFLDDIHPEQVINAIRELPEGYRVVFNMFTLDGYSHREIAGELGISESSSRSQLTRAKKMLRKKLTDLIPSHHEKRLARK